MSEQSKELGRVVHISGAKIVGAVSCLPGRAIDNSYFVREFGEVAVRDVVKMIGVDNRFWADERTSTRDLCAEAGLRLLQRLEWDSSSVDALIFVSQTPDFRLPASACLLQSDLRLSPASIAFDVNLGCSGYPYALWLGMMMVQSGAARRVLLAVGDTISKLIDPKDRSTSLLFGDAGTMTAIEASQSHRATFLLGTDGSGGRNLIVPRGGFRNSPITEDVRLSKQGGEFLYMDGGEIFNFTLRSVPALIKDTIISSGVALELHDGFLLHQANMFMLKHLIKKSKLALDKTPINISQFGNTSSASIPLLMTTSFRDQLSGQTMRLGMFGFGVGYSWGGVSLDVGPLKCVETIRL